MSDVHFVQAATRDGLRRARLVPWRPIRSSAHHWSHRGPPPSAELHYSHQACSALPCSTYRSMPRALPPCGSANRPLRRSMAPDQAWSRAGHHARPSYGFRGHDGVSRRKRTHLDADSVPRKPRRRHNNLTIDRGRLDAGRCSLRRTSLIPGETVGGQRYSRVCADRRVSRDCR